MEKRENAIPKTMKAWAVTTPGPIDGKNHQSNLPKSLCQLQNGVKSLLRY